MTIHFKILILLSHLLLVPLALSQYVLQRGTFGNGTTSSANSTRQLKGTVGQPLIGVAQNPVLQKNIGFWYQIQDLTSRVETISEDLPLENHLEQNFPNPFNPQTTIRFAIRHQGEVILKIFDVQGREVTTLLKQDLSPGVHQIMFNADVLPSGIYFYQICAKELLQTRKLLLVR